METAAGVKPLAFVIPRSDAGFDEQALIAHCAARSATFKAPLRVCALAAFPMTPGANASKLRKSKLRELARESLRGS